MVLSVTVTAQSKVLAKLRFRLAEACWREGHHIMTLEFAKEFLASNLYT